ncbi:MAG: hypothetical protein AB1Z23_01945 [Eubacteriales bacterium]
MRIFPYKEYIIETSMPKDAAVEKLLHHTKAKGKFRLAKMDEYFIGEVAEEGFDLLLRIFSINYNSRYYRPVIKGNMVQKNDRTEVRFSASASFMSKFIAFLVGAIFLGSAATQYSETDIVLLLLGFGVFSLLVNIGAIHLYFKFYMKRCMKSMELIFKENDSQNYKIYERSPEEYGLE